MLVWTEQLGGQFTPPNVVRVCVCVWFHQESDSEWQPRESHSWAVRPPQTDGVTRGGAALDTKEPWAEMTRVGQGASGSPDILLSLS